MAVSTASLAKEKNFIKENWKPILGIGATIGVTYVVWNIYKDLKKNDEPNPTKDLELQEDPRFEKSTLNDTQALNIANRLQIAMGTIGKANEAERQEIRSLLSGKSYNDYIKISKFFGQRGYISITGVSKDSDILAPKKNLTYWLSRELQPEDFTILKQALPGIF